MVPARLRQPGWRTTTRDLGRAPVQEDARAVSGGRRVSRSAGKRSGCFRLKAINDKRLVGRRISRCDFFPASCASGIASSTLPSMDSSIPTRKAIEAMTTTEHKIYENRLRRMAQRQGLRLIKSRRRDPNALQYGTYGLVDVQTNGLATYGGAVSEGYGLDLTEIEAHMRKLR